ncbi:MAG: SGNH/GDSL hydrolase family protein [Kiritimatiellae bacterium]|nr:SGNH/GDSL hydrolase family protein [Kiritimatiellia bacterium]
MEPVIEPGATMLFQGDSITDAGRGALDPENLGAGYAMMAASWFSAAYPEHNVRFINRGVSGNRAVDLEQRWERDCLDLKPDWVSIMIGINDTWRAFDSNDPTATEDYESAYRTILTQTVNQLGSHLVLIEPFVLPFPEDRKAWREDLDPRIQVVRSLADEFDAILVPMDGIMNAAAEKRDPDFWAPDGVHPTPAGHALIAQSWLRAVKAIA